MGHPILYFLLLLRAPNVIYVKKIVVIVASLLKVLAQSAASIDLFRRLWIHKRSSVSSVLETSDDTFPKWDYTGADKQLD